MNIPGSRDSPRAQLQLPTPPLDLGVIDLREFIEDFSGVLVAKNPPASEGDMGSIPGPGRSHMSPRILEPVLLNKRSHRNENLHTTESSCSLPQLEKAQQQRRSSTDNDFFFKRMY